MIGTFDSSFFYSFERIQHHSFISLSNWNWNIKNNVIENPISFLFDLFIKHWICWRLAWIQIQSSIEEIKFLIKKHVFSRINFQMQQIVKVNNNLTLLTLRFSHYILQNDDWYAKQFKHFRKMTHAMYSMCAHCTLKLHNEHYFVHTTHSSFSYTHVECFHMQFIDLFCILYLSRPFMSPFFCVSWMLVRFP